jgi:hypothetical protein
MWWVQAVYLCLRVEGNIYYKFSQAFQFLINKLKKKKKWYGRGLVMRMEQNDEVYSEAKMGGK